jgi:hypothetical protein
MGWKLSIKAFIGTLKGQVDLIAGESIRGEPAALLAAGILAILGTFAAAAALLFKPAKQVTTSDNVEALSLVLLGTSAALAAWRVAYENAIWVIAVAVGGIVGLAVIVLWFRS